VRVVGFESDKILVTWDSDKADLNLKNHQIRFETAKFAFDDPQGFMIPDRIRHGEQRYLSFGWVGNTFLAVCHLYEENRSGQEHFHLISARKGEKHEKRAYEKRAHESQGAY
jgi:uncharacterized protein